MENLGSFLREKRKAKGLSIEQVSDELRIRQTFLEALEEEKYELLPAPLYKKIFLKAYADYLGLNYEEILNKFPVEGGKVREKEELLTAPLKIEVRTSESISIKKRGINYNSWLVIAGILLGIIIILFFIMNQQISKYDNETGVSTREVKRGPSLPVSDTGKSEPKPAPKEEVKKTASQAKGMTLKLEGLDRTWAMVIGDGDTLFTGFINNGMQMEFQSQEYFKLTLGRAWAIRGYLNGERLKSFGPKGKSVYGREINKYNYRDFLDTTATD
ncbi:MAG TPA: RodZ domain-containing protein [Terriglobales bacterium]|nr:RodZ domain-containing protein [Terriglobales bacterium]